ncbi:hypothetical protein PSEUBRA_000712 [Kalmanozyma brasiliensis GHG001]|nr:uncharacterized protein PSEUBRA_000712 [Kalmanozyma brasiliensis GHG001]EST09499.2 hypothetical protein PSEUBRA_000712 [Kalmanozyma brasiliensis GHG001]
MSSTADVQPKEGKWGLMGWLAGHAAPGTPTKSKGKVEPLTTKVAIAANSKLGGLFSSLLNPPTQPPEREEVGEIVTPAQLLGLRTTCRVIFRVLILARYARYRNYPTTISSLVLDDLLG